MPVISVFFGIIITMYWREHNPPHFHAQYGDDEAIFSLETLDVLKGFLPKRAKLMVLEWAMEHRKELMENWLLCQNYEAPKQIEPLE